MQRSASDPAPFHTPSSAEVRPSTPILQQVLDRMEYWLEVTSDLRGTLADLQFRAYGPPPPPPVPADANGPAAPSFSDRFDAAANELTFRLQTIAGQARDLNSAL